jgi:pyruvate dehydrogenase E2 component (dihydrolipoyllysine-residue acetyltransferase)
MSRVIDVRVPDMGNFKDVAVIDVLVKAGDAVELETPLVTLETEKATMDVPSTASGIIERVVVSKGGHVNAGDVVVAVRSEGESEQTPTPTADGGSAAGGGAGAAGAAGDASAVASSSAPSPAAGNGAAAAAAPTPSARSASSPPASSSSSPTSAAQASTDMAAALPSGVSGAHASPSVRKLSRELGVNLALVGGTGFKGRVTQDDVKAFVKKTLQSAQGGRGAASAKGSGLPSVPVVDFAAFGPTEVKPLSRIQRISGARLHASWVNLPHVTQFDEADITGLEALRAELKDKAASRGIKITPLAFILRACVKALQEFPQFNASLDPSGENLILKKYIHVGFAADTPNGLLVPVIHDADRKDIYELARASGELAGKARAGTLGLAEMQGGCFTISSLGGIGGTAFTPIINAPEVAILGVSRSALKPVFVDGAFLPRLMLPLSLSYDHRVIDGALAVRFTTFLVRALADAHGLAEAVP